MKNKRHNGHQYQQAYTLLELLIVLVIISVMLSLTALSLSGAQSDPAEGFLKRLRFDVELAANEAIIRSEPMALGFSEQGYAFFRLDEESELWEAIEKDNMLKPRKLKEGLRGALYLEGLAVSLPFDWESVALIEPQVFVYPTGEVTPFSYQVQYQDEAMQRVEFNMMGQVVKDEDALEML